MLNIIKRIQNMTRVLKGLYLKNVFYILNRIQNLKRVLKGLTLNICVKYTESYTKLETSAKKGYT